jgi:SET domain-containing protein
MPFFKQVEKKDAQEKYGFSHQGIFAKEAIKRGEAIFTCDLSICDYLKIENVNSSKSKEETIKIMNTSPEIQDFIHKYCYMMDDDLFDWPRNYKDFSLVEDCMFFNHSCDPNCGFQAIDESLVVAIRDIEVGEELTYDYQCIYKLNSSYLL